MLDRFYLEKGYYCQFIDAFLIPSSRLSSSNLTPKAVEERLKIADDYKEKFKKEVEEHKAKREQVRTTLHGM